MDEEQAVTDTAPKRSRHVNLWFKATYVHPILAGVKRDTVRQATPRIRKLAVGQRVSFSVGPRPAFALATIESIELVAFGELPLEKQRVLERLGYVASEATPFARIGFHKVTRTDEAPAPPVSTEDREAR